MIIELQVNGGVIMELLGSADETQILLESLQDRYFQDGSARIIPKSVGEEEPHQTFATRKDSITWVDVLAQASRQKQSYLLTKVDATKGRAEDTSA